MGEGPVSGDVPFGMHETNLAPWEKGHARRPATPVEPDDVVEFVVHGALAPRLIDWLNGLGFDVYDLPDDGRAPDALRSLMVTPGDALWERHEREMR